MKFLISAAFAIIFTYSFSIKAEEPKVLIYLELTRTTKGFSVYAKNCSSYNSSTDQIQQAKSLMLTTGRIFHRIVRVNTISTWIYDGDSITQIKPIFRINRKKY